MEQLYCTECLKYLKRTVSVSEETQFMTVGGSWRTLTPTNLKIRYMEPLRNVNTKLEINIEAVALCNGNSVCIHHA